MNIRILYHCMVFLMSVGAGGTVWGQEKITCPNGEVRLRIDVAQLALTYQAKSFETTLTGLWGLAVSKTSVTPKALQEASAATQQWNELIKGLAAGYNSCVISQQQYDYGLNRIYPRLKEDAVQLEQIRQALLKGHARNAKYHEILLKSYFENLRGFAKLSNDNIVDAIQKADDQIVFAQHEHVADLSRLIIQNAEEIKRQLASLPKPEDVQTEIGAELREVANEAQREYTQAYELLEEFRFSEAIPHLRNALEVVPMSAFYLALADALRQLPDLPEAERVVRDGLSRTQDQHKHEAELNNELGMILRDKGDLVGALEYTRHALNIAERFYGADHPVTKMINASLHRIDQLANEQKKWKNNQ